MRFRNEHAFDAEIAKAAARYEIPEWVIRATIATESSFDPTAFNRNDPGGSRGLMQIIPATARGLGFTGGLGNDSTRDGGLYMPGLSIELGTRLLRQLVDGAPDGTPWDGIYAAYNAGPKVLREPLLIVDGKPDYPNRVAVNRWRSQADYFRPTWRQEEPSDPFEQAPPEGASSREDPPAPASSSCNGSPSASSPGPSTGKGGSTMDLLVNQQEYRTVAVGDDGAALDEELNALGLEGFSIVGATAGVVFLCRPKGARGATLEELATVQRQQQLAAGFGKGVPRG